MKIATSLHELQEIRKRLIVAMESLFTNEYQCMIPYIGLRHKIQPSQSHYIPKGEKLTIRR